MFRFLKRRRNNMNAEYLPSGTRIMYRGEQLIISGSYPSKQCGFIYITTSGAALYRDEFEIVSEE